MKSDFMNLNARDFIRGAIVSILPALGTFGSIVAPILKLHRFPSESEWVVAVTETVLAVGYAFGGYLTLNFVTNSRGKIGKE